MVVQRKMRREMVNLILFIFHLNKLRVFLGSTT
jgi:hypothetical protein